MDNSLILSHLPIRFAYNECLSFIKELNEPPPARSLGDALCIRFGPREVWEALESATREAELTARALNRLRINVVHFWSERYPQKLRCIEDPPWTLFFLGCLPNPDPVLAVVGTRRPDSYGTELIASFLPSMQTRPLQIVSGLAYGIDALAHFYACESSIPNFAVMGCGLDTIYPTAHLELATRILSGGGGLLSELPPGSPPAAWHFPRRNRIISGLADVIWIVQGSPKSGSYHTARHALRQAKVVVAAPGNVFNELSEVPNRLLYDGAQPILRSGDLDLLLDRKLHSIK